MTAIDTNLPPKLIPRPTTSIARRRSWNEPTVRGWWLGSLLVLILAGHAMYVAIQESADTNWLIAHGTPVDAVIYVHDGAQLPGFSAPPDAQLNFKFPWNGRHETVTGSLPEQTEHVTTGHTTTLHVDPDDPAHWTSRTIPLKWWTQLTATIVLFILAMLLLGVAALLRRQRLRTFQFGELIDAVVVETRSNPLAPLSSIVRCRLPEKFGRRVVTVYLPRSVGKVTRDQTIPIIVVPQAPGRALAATAYL